MGRLLRFSAPGVAGLGLVVAAYSVFWLWTTRSRNDLEKPTPIHVRRVIPIYDGTSVWDTDTGTAYRR